ncbi:putative membrane protein [Arthrobacter sp. UYEF3]
MNVPLSQAYNQWTQFEDFPQFMSGVDAVRHLEDTTVHFQTSIGGVKRDYNARITSQDPGRQVAWEGLDGPRNAGSVRFTELGPAETRVDVELVWEPGSPTEKIGAAVGLDSRQVGADLLRFKKFIEGRDFETGAWRERVNQGDVAGPTPAGPLLTDTGYDVVGPRQTAGTDPDMATEPAFDGITPDDRRDRRASDR